MEIINYENIDLIGKELFRKNNDNFTRSKLSPVMEKMFIAANKAHGITEIDDEMYMKSSAIPDRVYYVYSDQLNKVAKDKIFDIVVFKDRPCIWFYSKNAIDKIGEDPVYTTINIFTTLLSLFRTDRQHEYISSFISIENNIIITAMCTRLFKFMNETYGVLDFEKCKEELIEMYWDNSVPSLISSIKFHKTHTRDSIHKFIEDIVENYNNPYYYKHKLYLDSYNLIEYTDELIEDEEHS